MLKVIDKLNSPLTLAFQRRKGVFKYEDIGYVSAFLAMSRNKLLPYHAKSLKHYPTQEEIDKINKEIYEELNQ